MMNIKHKQKVLVIDEEGDLGELLEIGLKDDYVVDIIYDSKAALVKIPDFNPNLIITGKSIYQEASDIFAEIKKKHPIPIILVLASKSQQALSVLQKKGVVSVMVKPFTLKELKSKIYSALEKG